MLSRKEIKELAAIHGDGNIFVSLYLNVNPLTNPKGDYIIHFKNMLKGTLEKIDKETAKKIKDDIEKIGSYLNAIKRELKKGLGLISSSHSGLWKDYHLAIPVKNEIIVDKTPYIKPLIDILDNYQRYAVLLVDKESARLFLIHLGEIEEYTEVFTPDVPGRHKKGGWFSLSESRYERHTAFHVALHLKDVAKAIEDFLPKEYIGRIIVGGSEDAVLRLKAMLPHTISEKIIGTFHAEIFSGEKDILERSMEIMEAFEHKKEQAEIEELITRAMKNNQAVIGLEDVLLNLREGRVMKLFLLKDYSASGFRCVNCGYLTSFMVIPCPYCKGDMETVNYLTDLAVQKAVEQGALIEVVSDNARLKEAGSIGAFLRF